MKYIIVLGDGMADYPVPELGNRTPLQAANAPMADFMAKHGTLGLVKTVPDDLAPGSDTANLSVMGYDPHVYYSGRSPFEAASMGVPMKPTDITFRCNIVTLSEEEPYEEKRMLDHSADEITTEEARELIKDVSRHLATELIKFYPGISYRHLMIWDNGPYSWKLTPPHDIINQKITDYLPKGEGCEVIEHMLRESSKFLAAHPVNQKRIQAGKRPGNSIWIWGEGKKPLLASFEEKYGLKGSVISAVDLIKGIGQCAELDSIEVEGATGNIHTNFKGKAVAAVQELKNGKDFVYIHIEAPDECGHRFEMENKVKSIELIDSQIIEYVKQEMDKLGEDYRMMFLPDHPTPLSLRTHTHNPVPFVIYDSRRVKDFPGQTYDEACAEKTGFFVQEGYKLMDYFING